MQESFSKQVPLLLIANSAQQRQTNIGAKQKKKAQNTQLKSIQTNHNHTLDTEPCLIKSETMINTINKVRFTFYGTLSLKF